MARAFVNTDLGQPERVQTVARPTGISAPIATIQPTPGMALASSLASLSPKLQEHIQTVQGWHQEDEANRAYDTIQGMTHAEAQAEIAAGTMKGTESPWFRAAFQKQFGMAHAAERRRQIITDYNTSFDKDGGDIDGFLKGYVQEDLQQYGGSEFILAGLREGMGNTLGTLRDQHAEYRSGQLQARAVDQFYSVAGAAVDDAVASGGDVGAALAGTYSDHTAAFGMTPDQMDEQAMGLAQRYASEGNVTALEQLLASDPSGRGAFSTRSGFDLKAEELRAAAKDVAGKAYREGNFDAVTNIEARAASGTLDERDMDEINTFVETGSMSAAERESLVGRNKTAQTGRLGDVFEMNVKTEAMNQTAKALKTGNAALIVDQTVTNPHTGAEVKLSASDLVDATVEEQITGMLDKDATPQVVAAQLASWGVPSTYKPWENLMTNGANAISVQLATLGPDGLTKLPTPAVAGYTLFRALESQRAVRDHHIKDAKVAALYRDAELLERHGNLTPEEALLSASRIDRSGSNTNLSVSIDRNTFEQQAKKVTSGGFWAEDAENEGDVAQALESLTRTYMGLGLGQDAALTSAAEDIQSTYTNVNGILVNTRDKFIPPDFKEIATIAVEDYAASQGRDADEFRLWPVDGQNSWVIQEVGTLRPARGAAPIHISKLQKNPRAWSMADANEEVRANR